MKPRSLESRRFIPTVTTTSRACSNPPLLKRLKKLVGCSCQGITNVKSRTGSCSSLEHERRAEALKSVGLLKQSVKYGGSYRDQEDDEESRTIFVLEEEWGKATEDEKDLIFFEDEDDGSGLGKDSALSTVDEMGMSVRSPSPPTTPGPDRSVCLLSDSDCCSSEMGSTLESETSTLTSEHPPIRIRKVGSLVEEISQIRDEESRRLTELAYLS